MKVICIDDDFFISEVPEESITPKVGEIYTVKNQGNCDCCGGLWYELEEIEYEWDADSFAPISDIDETEMERNYKRNPISVGMQRVRSNKITIIKESNLIEEIKQYKWK